ncbi:MAG: hypothetical protein WKF77_01835 [Planctomycetaceae bacterium]
MSKIGLTIAAGLILATGVWGMSHLAAFQNADEGGGAANATAAEENQGAPDLKGRTEVAADEAPAGSEVTVAGEVTVAPDSHAAAVNESVDETGLGDGSGGMGSPKSPTAKPRRLLKGAAAEFSRRSERDAERRLNEQMQTERIGNLQFPGENPLPDILETLSVMLSESRGNPVLIRPDVMEFNNDSIVLSDVMIRDIMIPEGLMTVGSAVDHVLSQTNPPLTWIARDELLLITTVSAAESDENMILRSYDITRLREITQLTVTTWDAGGGQQGGGDGFFSVVFEPSQFGGGGGGGMPSAATQKKKTQPSKPQPEESESAHAKQESVITWEAGLIQTIQDLTAPPCRWFDIDGEGGELSIAGNRLLVRQSRKGHEQVVAVLEQLEMAADDAAEEQ